MSSVTIPAPVVSTEPAPLPLAKPKERLLSLDIFRGMTLIAMVLVNMPGDERFTYAPISHVKWDGWSIADLIFPFFIFIVGVAMPYSFSGRLARGDSQGKLLAHILQGWAYPVPSVGYTPFRRAAKNWPMLFLCRDSLPEG
jgi:predicted acyltransferase